MPFFHQITLNDKVHNWNVSHHIIIKPYLKAWMTPIISHQQSELCNLNFHPLQVVSRYRDPQLQVTGNIWGFGSGGSRNWQTRVGADIFSRIYTHHSWQSQPLICSKGVGKFCNLRPQMTHSGAYLAFFVWGGGGAPAASPSESSN